MGVCDLEGMSTGPDSWKPRARSTLGLLKRSKRLLLDCRLSALSAGLIDVVEPWVGKGAPSGLLADRDNVAELGSAVVPFALLWKR